MTGPVYSPGFSAFAGQPVYLDGARTRLPAVDVFPSNFGDLPASAVLVLPMPARARRMTRRQRKKAFVRRLARVFRAPL